jgi:NADPH2:quinone reductase
MGARAWHDGCNRAAGDRAPGAAPPVAMTDLAGRSITITRPVVFHYLEDRAVLEQAASALFAAIAAGVLSLEIAARFPLAQADAAHRMLEARQSIGSLVLLP